MGFIEIGLCYHLRMLMLHIRPVLVLDTRYILRCFMNFLYTTLHLTHLMYVPCILLISNLLHLHTMAIYRLYTPTSFAAEISSHEYYVLAFGGPVPV